MFTCVLGRYVASTVLLSTQTFGGRGHIFLSTQTFGREGPHYCSVPKPSEEGADSVGGQLRGNKEWRKQFWQSLEEGVGKRCGSVPPDLSLLCGRTGWDGARLVNAPPPPHPPRPPLHPRLPPFMPWERAPRRAVSPVEWWWWSLIVQELCESRGGRPGLSVLASLLVSVHVKIY